MSKMAKKAGAEAPAVSDTAIIILGARVGGEREEIHEKGAMIKIGSGAGQVSRPAAELMIANGVAAWVGDKQGLQTAGDKARQAAQKSQAVQAMSHHDSLSPDERARIRDDETGEGSDTL